MTPGKPNHESGVGSSGSTPPRLPVPAADPPSAPGPDGILLDVDGVSIAFGGVVALNDVRLQVPPGSLISVIGPNGAGKTTLFNCICGLYRPNRGHIRFAGHDLARLKPDRIARLGIARTFQNIELFLRMTTLDNVLLGRHLRIRAGFASAILAAPNWRREEVRHREVAEHILDFLDLQAVRDRRVGDLPLGRQRLVELARAMATEPRLLLLDEPSSGMTAEEKEDLVFRITDLREEMGITVVLVEHDLKLAMGLADWIAVLDHGTKIAEGPPEQVQRDPEVIRAYLGEPTMNRFISQ